MSKIDSDPPAKIRALNDAFRRTFVGGAVVITADIAAMPAEARPIANYRSRTSGRRPVEP